VGVSSAKCTGSGGPKEGGEVKGEGLKSRKSLPLTKGKKSFFPGFGEGRRLLWKVGVERSW